MEKRILDKLHKTEINILDEIVEICKKNNLEYFLVGGTLLGAVRHKGFIPWDDDLDIGMPREDYEKFLKIAKNELKENYILDCYKNNKKYWLSFAKIRIKNTEYVEKDVAQYSTENGIWVDIFPLDNTKKENSLILKVQWQIIKLFKIIASNKLQVEQKVTNIKEFIRKVVRKITNIQTLMSVFNKIMKLQNNKNNKYFINFGSQYGIKKQTHLKEKYMPTKELEFEGKMYKVPNDSDYVLTKIYGKNYMQLPPIEKRVTHNPVSIKFEDGEEIIFDEQ